MALTPPGGIPRTTDDIAFTGAVRVNAGTAATGFSIADPTDATKVLIFDCSGLTTGTTNTFAPAAGGTEVTVDGTQTLTNKTLTSPVINTPTIAVLASALSIKGADATKVAKFSAESITTATTRTYTLPDVSDTVVTLGATQTLTAKTLTSPTINAAAISGAVSGGATYASPVLTTPTVNGATLTGTITRTTQTLMVNSYARPGAGVGFVAGAVLATNVGNMATLPQAQTASTLVIQLPDFHATDIITGFFVLGNITSGGNAATLDADLRSLTAASGGPTDASLGTITQVSVVANTLVNSANSTKTLSSPETVTNGKAYYLLLTATTGVGCTMTINAVGLIVTQS